jgi:hypothetical protein
MKIRNWLANELNLAFVDTAYKPKMIPSDVNSATKRQRIRCPICLWVPDGKPYWMCEKCFAKFDTFKTHAHCPTPECGNTWGYTQCIACHRQSRHEEWYEEVESTE